MATRPARAAAARFERDGLPARITVADALALPAVRQGLPVVAAGERNLERPIRWVHAGEVSYIASVLLGGELLLTTGMGIGRRASAQRRFINELDDAGAAALFVELGGALDDLPPALVAAAEERGLPLVAFRRDVRFIPVTEAIHTELVNSRYAVLQRVDEIHRKLTQVVLDGGGIPEVLRVLAQTLSTPVVLEGAGGRMLAHALPGGEEREGERGEDALATWATTRGRASRAPWRAGLSAPVPLGPGAPGRLVVLPVSAPLDELARLTLDRAAGLVALSLLRSRQEEELLARERGSVLHGLANGRLTVAAARRQAQLLGFAPAARLLLPLAAEAGAPVEPAEWSLVLRDAQTALEGRGTPALVGQHERAGQLLALVAVHDFTGSDSPVLANGRIEGGQTVGASERERAADTVADALRAAAARHLGDVPIAIAVGRASGWDAAGPELALAADGAASAGAGGFGATAAWHDARALELQRLLWRWREDPELAALVERRLGALIAHDRRRRHALLPTLEELCANGGHKAQTARALHLNRQALYQRIERIERLLGVDLADPRELLTLHLALEARRFI
ncbi:MAG TPA: PucR family transcriptional regulator [Conexibacter sp.]|jgi:purine catabolism regulator